MSYRAALFATALVLLAVVFPSFAVEAPNADMKLLEQLRDLNRQRQPQLGSPQQLAQNQPNQAATRAVASPAPAKTTQQAQQQVLAEQRAQQQRQKQQQNNAAVQQMVMGSQRTIDEAAFRSMSRNLMPLSPEQILRLRQKYNSTRYAEAATPGTPPRPTATSQFVNLAPGTTPPVIRLSQGFVSSLVFLDSTGAPWPIANYDLGNPSAFNIQWDKKSNTLMVQATKLYTYGNLAVRLRGLPTPVMLTLIPGQKAVDYRVDLRVQGYGPNAKPFTTATGLPPHADNVLLSVLDGVPPTGAKQLTIAGGEAEAWTRNNTMFVRTRLNIISPGWLATMSSADGMHAYKMQKTPLLLVSQRGKVVQLKVEGL